MDTICSFYLIRTIAFSTMVINVQGHITEGIFRHIGFSLSFYPFFLFFFLFLFLSFSFLFLMTLILSFAFSTMHQPQPANTADISNLSQHFKVMWSKYISTDNRFKFCILYIGKNNQLEKNNYIGWNCSLVYANIKSSTKHIYRKFSSWMSAPKNLPHLNVIKKNLCPFWLTIAKWAF